MERVLNQSWHWIRAWVPPGITAIALVASMVGLWFVMTDPDRLLFATDQPSGTPSKAERAADSPGYRHASSAKASSSLSSTGPSATGSATSAATLTSATPASECTALQREMDSVAVRVRAAGKSKQGLRFRSRLRELKELYAEECKQGSGPAL